MLIIQKLPNLEPAMRDALKHHIIRKRKRLKQELEQDAIEKRLKKEKELKHAEDAMTLDQITQHLGKLEKKLETLKEEKNNLFVQLKHVLNEKATKCHQSLNEATKQSDDKDDTKFAKPIDPIPRYSRRIIEQSPVFSQASTNAHNPNLLTITPLLNPRSRSSTCRRDQYDSVKTSSRSHLGEKRPFGLINVEESLASRKHPALSNHMLMDHMNIGPAPFSHNYFQNSSSYPVGYSHDSMTNPNSQEMVFNPDFNHNLYSPVSQSLYVPTSIYPSDNDSLNCPPYPSMQHHGMTSRHDLSYRHMRHGSYHRHPSTSSSYQRKPYTRRPHQTNK